MAEMSNKSSDIGRIAWSSTLDGQLAIGGFAYYHRRGHLRPAI